MTRNELTRMYANLLNIKDDLIDKWIYRLGAIVFLTIVTTIIVIWGI